MFDRRDILRYDLSCPDSKVRACDVLVSLDDFSDTDRPCTECADGFENRNDGLPRSAGSAVLSDS